MWPLSVNGSENTIEILSGGCGVQRKDDAAGVMRGRLRGQIDKPQSRRPGNAGSNAHLIGAHYWPFGGYRALTEHSRFQSITFPPDPCQA